MSECSHDFDSNELSNYCAKGCGETWALYTIKNLQKENDILREALEFYANFDSWRTTNNQRTYATIDDDDLGNGDFEQSTGPNHVLNSVSCLDNGGRRARQALEKVSDERK